MTDLQATIPSTNTRRVKDAYHPDDVRAVMDANRPRLFGIASAVKAAMEKNNVR